MHLRARVVFWSSMCCKIIANILLIKTHIAASHHGLYIFVSKRLQTKSLFIKELRGAAVSPCRAFFPFSSNLDTWPLAASKGSRGQTFIGPDALFGAALNCTAIDSANASLPTIPYGANGSFSINFWMRTTAPGGQQYSYVFNHMGTQGRPTRPTGRFTEDWGPDQVSMSCFMNGLLAVDGHFN